MSEQYNITTIQQRKLETYLKTMEMTEVEDKNLDDTEESDNPKQYDLQYFLKSQLFQISDTIYREPQTSQEKNPNDRLEDIINSMRQKLEGESKKQQQGFIDDCFIQLSSNHFTQSRRIFLGNKSQQKRGKQVYQFYQTAPTVFQKLKVYYQMNYCGQNYMKSESILKSLFENKSVTADQTTGKSGSMFYSILDNKILFKTISQAEFEYFAENIQQYYNHQIKFPNTLIVRIYGLYKLKIYENEIIKNTVYFISMENLFWELEEKSQIKIKIKEIYDLKGSFYGRNGSEPRSLKDNDWIQSNRKINFPHQLKESFKSQIDIDSNYLGQNNVNDYSLIVALVEIDKQIWIQQKQANQQKQTNINIFKSFKGGVLGKKPGQLYVFGIIDILTVFETKKHLQYYFKTIFISNDVSCIPPDDYCQRFQQFVKSAIKDPDYHIAYSQH